jgi:hypothetical protein
MKNYLLAFSAFLLFTSLKTLPDPVFKVLRFDKTDKTFKDSIKGELIDGLSWKDAAGENRVLFTMIPVEMKKDGSQSGALYAYCFIKTATGWKKKWEVKDRVDACEVDVTCEFFPGSFTITDNDRNNIGEVTFLYKLSCKGDVSPDEKKLIMYEGTNKYAIRGSTILHLPEEKLGGDKRIDASFTKAAKPLLDFANSQWDKFGTMKY